MWYLTASVTPKAYTAGTVTTFTARANTGATASAEAQNNGGVFTAGNWAVPMGEAVGGNRGPVRAVRRSSSPWPFSDESGTIRTPDAGNAVRRPGRLPAGRGRLLERRLGERRDLLRLPGFEDRQRHRHPRGTDGRGAGPLLQRRGGAGVVRASGRRREPLGGAGLCADVLPGGAGGPSPRGKRPVPWWRPSTSPTTTARISGTCWAAGGTAAGTLYGDHPGSLNGQYADWRPGDPLQIWE